MSSDGPKRSAKLSFKGEKPKKRKRKERTHDDGDEDEAGGDAQGELLYPGTLPTDSTLLTYDLSMHC